MRKNGLTALLAAVMMAVSSCGEKKAVDTYLLGYIPSDASAVVVGESLSSSLESLFGPDDVFMSLRPGKLAEEQAVVSFHYGGQLNAVLAISAGRASERPSESVNEFCRQLDSLGLISMYIPAESGHRNVLLVCESQSLLASARRHLQEGASILDAAGIEDALLKVQDGGQTMILRNSAASQFLDKDFLAGRVNRRTLLSFIDSFSKWTVFHVKRVQPAGRGELITVTVDPISDGAANSFSDYLAALEPGQSQLAEVLPHGTNYAVSLPIASVPDFLEARKRYLDSVGGLNRFNVFCRTNRTQDGMDPQKWAASLDIREVGRINTKGESLLLLRTGAKSQLSGISQNPWKGYCGVLFGEHFRLSDENCCAPFGDWIVIGSPKAVVHFLDSPSKGYRKDLFKGSCRAAVLADDIRISWNADEIELEMYKTY